MPTEIWTAEDLDNVRNNLAGNYIQMDDIDLTAWGDWTPIWAGWASPFTGVFDGNGKIIDNLTINLPEDSEVGLFGYVDGGELKNITIRNANVTGDNYVGILCGYIWESLNIENCHCQGTVCGAEHMFGGLAGRADESSIENCSTSGTIINNSEIAATGNRPSNVGGLMGMMCYSTLTKSSSAMDIDLTVGSVDVGDHIGGLLGYTCASTIRDCYARGNVTSQGNKSVGGFVGIAATNSTIIENCYARGNIVWGGDISIFTGVGGFAGKVTALGVAKCYSTGAVPGDHNQIGGFCGGDDLVSTACYYDTETSGQSDTGKGEPRLTAQMVYPYTGKHIGGTFVDWGFEEVHITDLTEYDFVFGVPWKHDPTFTLNDGYPLFETTPPGPEPTLTKIADCYTPTTPTLSISLDYGPFNNTVIERQDTMIAQYRFTNPPTGLTLKTKWRYLTPKLEHNVICGFECRGILIRYKLKGKKPKLIPEFE